MGDGSFGISTSHSHFQGGRFSEEEKEFYGKAKESGWSIFPHHECFHFTQGVLVGFCWEGKQKHEIPFIR